MDSAVADARAIRQLGDSEPALLGKFAHAQFSYAQILFRVLMLDYSMPTALLAASRVRIAFQSPDALIARIKPAPSAG
jgi:hypothetical protein